MEKVLFTRETKKGLLECKSIDGVVRFFLNRGEIRRKTMIDIDNMAKIRKDPYYKPALPYLEAGGFAGMWNAQVALHQNEIDIIASEREMAKKEAQEKARNILTVYLSSRGWGDFSPVVWSGNVDTADAEIVRQSQELLASEHDVDQPNQTEEQILAKIAHARKERDAKKDELKQRKKEALTYIAKVEESVMKAFDVCNGDPDRLPDDIDHPLYWEVKRYANALLDANLEV